MPRSWILDEDKWEKAKEIARKQGRGNDYAYIVGIYRRMGGREKHEKSLGRVVIILS